MNQVPKVWLLGNEATREPVRYTGCGLDDVWLASGYELDTIDGEVVLTVREF